MKNAKIIKLFKYKDLTSNSHDLKCYVILFYFLIVAIIKC